MALAGHEHDFAPVRFIVGAKIEPFQTRSKDVPQDAVARGFAVPVCTLLQACSIAFGASYVGEPDGFRVFPLHRLHCIH
jgi:hypothetical protein